MMRFIRDLRLIPIAVIASACLLALKTADILLDRETPAATEAAPEATLIRAAPGVPRPGDAKQSWAEQMFNFPGANGAPPAPTELTALPNIAPLAADKTNGDIITGSVAEKKDEKAEAKDGKPATDGKPANPSRDGPPGNAGAPLPPGRVVLSGGAPGPSAAERALFERLGERRQELDKRARELDIREGLIAEAEKRMEARLAEIKEGEAQLATATQKRDEAEVARFKGLVTMYENMKPRDAAKIFDRLEVGVLLEMASQINPRRMSDIMALMSPETAEKLTVELASRAKAETKSGNADLPKIEGRPNTQ
jgi:flagellar motility protein MotE (MotC chaperone)